jgi:predicted nucleic acid-binding protein
MTPQPKTLFDITVLMDALINDQEPGNPSSAVLELAAKGRIQGYVCAAAIDPLHDELSRTRGSTRAHSAMQRICATLAIAPVDAAVIDGAMSLGWRNLADALAFESARQIGLDSLVTLNGPDFDDPALAVHCPEELLRTLHRAS